MNTFSKTTEHTSTKCAFCGEGHHVYDCDAFRKLPAANRLREVRKRPLCYCCLSAGHLVPSCEKKKPCGLEGCERRHHQMLHYAFEGVDSTYTSHTQRKTSYRAESNDRSFNHAAKQRVVLQRSDTVNHHAATRPATTDRRATDNR